MFFFFNFTPSLALELKIEIERNLADLTKSVVASGYKKCPDMKTDMKILLCMDTELHVAKVYSTTNNKSL